MFILSKLAESLTSKTVPLTKKTKSQHQKGKEKRKRSKSPIKDIVNAASSFKKHRHQSAAVKELEDDDAPSQVVNGSEFSVLRMRLI